MASPLPPSTADPFDLRPARPSRGATAVLFHGFTGTPYELRPLAAGLAARGLRCVGPLLPGHGTSPAELAATPAEAWVAAGRACVLRALADSAGPVVVGGLSAGALLAAVLGGALAGRVAAVVLLAPAVRLFPEAQGVLAAARLAPGLPWPSIPKRSAGGDCGDPAGRAANPAYRETPLAALAMLGQLQDAAAAALPCVTAPVLVVHGARDSTVPAGASAGLPRALVRAARVERHLLPRSRHLLPLDVERDELLTVVARFLAREGVLAPE